MMPALEPIVRAKLILCLSVGSLSGLAGCAPTPVASLSVRELNIVDASGRARLRLAAPLTSKAGSQGKRRNPAYGIQFIDMDGKEVGGLGLIDAVEGRALCWDYSVPRREAICFSLIRGKPLIWFNDSGAERLRIGVADGTAFITLSDASGKPRLRLQVDKSGRSQVESISPENKHETK